MIKDPEKLFSSLKKRIIPCIGYGARLSRGNCSCTFAYKEKFNSCYCPDLGEKMLEFYRRLKLESDQTLIGRYGPFIFIISENYLIICLPIILMLLISKNRYSSKLVSHKKEWLTNESLAGFQLKPHSRGGEVKTPWT